MTRVRPRLTRTASPAPATDASGADAWIHALTVSITLLSTVPALVVFLLRGAAAGFTWGTILLMLTGAVLYAGTWVVVPWYRLRRDLFALQSAVGAGLIAFVVAHTGAAASPFVVYFFLIVAFAAHYHRLPIALLVTALTSVLSVVVTTTSTTSTALGPETLLRVTVFVCLTVGINQVRTRLHRVEQQQRLSEARLDLLQQESHALRRRAAGLELLNRVVTATGATDAAALCSSATHGLLHALEVQRTAVILAAAGSESGHIIVACGDDRAGGLAGSAVVVRGTPLEAIDGMAPLVVDDLAADSRLASLRGQPLHQDAVSLLVIPLMCEGVRVGFLTAATIGAAHVFSDEDLQLAQTVGATLGAALVSMRRHEEAEWGRRRGEALSAVAAVAGRPPHVDELGAQTLAILTATLSIDGGVLYLVNHTGTHLQAMSHRGIAEATIDEDASMPLDAPRLTAEVARNGRPAFSGVPLALPPGTLDALRRMQAKGYAIVPLVARDHVIGVMTLTSNEERVFTAEEQDLLVATASIVALALDNMRLSASTELTAVETIAALGSAIEARDGYTGEHCERMAERAVAVGRVLDLSAQEIATIRLGAALHDVGKIGIPDAILNKPARLDPDEFAVMQTHPEIGARIVGAVEQLRGVVPLVRHHHERYDGTGYPDGLAGDTIPMGARVLAVVDAYGAMTEDRVYRRAPGHERAVAEIERGAGTHFDPHVARAFLTLFSAPAPDLDGAGRSATMEAVTAIRGSEPPIVVPARLEPQVSMATVVERDVLFSTQAVTDEIAALFEREHDRTAVVLGEDGIPGAILTRQRLLVKLSGLYGNALYRQRPVVRVADGRLLIVEGSLSPEEAARRATARPADLRYDPIVVTTDGQFVGLVAVSQLLDHINSAALRHAQLSNPLTGLPGAPLLEAEVNARTTGGRPLALVLADADGFKAYNDHYGLAKGDEVLLMLGHLLQDLAVDAGDADIVGHIGGDDFVVLTTPERAAHLCAEATQRFDDLVRRFYTPHDLAAGGIVAEDRSGQRRLHDVMGLSVVAVAAEELQRPSYHALTQEATARKVAAKRHKRHVAARTVA